jgi:hypothetical protein
LHPLSWVLWVLKTRNQRIIIYRSLSHNDFRLLRRLLQCRKMWHLHRYFVRLRWIRR